MEPIFEFFDHTADMGMRVYAPTMSALLVPATRGLYAMMGDLATSDGGAVDALTIGFVSDEPAIMLRDFLDELLVRFERDKKVAVAFDETELSEERLHASVRMAAIDETRSVFHREVKAITYHELDIVPVKGGFKATVIVDI